MKTVKIKVEPTNDTAEKVALQLKELEWVWNKARQVALHNHCIEWRKWAKKKSKAKGTDFYGVSFEGCIDTPLFFSRRGGWNGATCRIADGGPYWKKAEPGEPGLDGEPLKVIEYWKGSKFEDSEKDGQRHLKSRGELKYAKPRKLVEGDRPYQLREIKPHELLTIGGKVTKKVNDLDNMRALNAQREHEGLPPLTCHSDFVGGLLKDFETAWKAYIDPTLQNRSQPKYKDGKQWTLATLSNAQNPPKFNEKKGVFVAGGLMFTPTDRSWQKRVGDRVMRSFKIISRPSGWYMCVSVCSEMQAYIPTLKNRANKLSSRIKKQVGATHPNASGKTLKALLDEAKLGDSDYQKALQDIKDAQHAVAIENHESAPYRYRTGKKAGIDPGVKYIVSTSEKGGGGGFRFEPNHSRRRIKNHVAKLQKQLDIKRNSNDKRTGLNWKKGERSATKNEAALQARIQRLQERSRNSSNAFNHKLSTKLAEAYDAIAWENTQIPNMVKSAQPKLSPTGAYYLPNMGKAKSGLNESLSLAAIGDLKAKTEAKMRLVSKEFHGDAKTANSSITCNTCGNTDKEQRIAQETFKCFNPKCPDHLAEKNADTNAANNIFDSRLSVNF